MYTYHYHVCMCVCVCITAGDVGGLVAPAAAECRGGDDDDTRVKHFFTQSIDIHIIYLYYYMARDTKTGLLFIHNVYALQVHAYNR